MSKNFVKSRVKYISIAMILCMIITMIFSGIPAQAASKKKKILVVYFSVTGNTEDVAKKIKKATGAKLYKIKPAVPYTDEDIEYGQDDCRANVEQRSNTARPKIKGKVKKIRQYDYIFVGYPIWWGKEPKVVKTFLESYNLKGKKIIPFCTSGSSGISGSIKGIKASAKGAKVLKGKDLTDDSYKSIKKWAKKKIK